MPVSEDTNELVSVVRITRENPAGGILILSGPMEIKQHVCEISAMFPLIFESMHGKATQKNPWIFRSRNDGAQTCFRHQLKSSGLPFSIFFAPRTAPGATGQKPRNHPNGPSELKIGQVYQTGVDGFSLFIADELYDHAAIVRRVERAPAEGKGQMAAGYFNLRNN